MLPSGVVLAYHGCDREVGEHVLSGATEIQPSSNDYDWLGTGAYFWEGNAQRALEWACFLQQRPSSSRGKIRQPFVVGAVILPGLCLDLTEADSLSHLAAAYARYAFLASLAETPLPQNLPGAEDDADLVKRHLDCAVLIFFTSTAPTTASPPSTPSAAHSSREKRFFPAPKSQRAPTSSGVSAIQSGASSATSVSVELPLPAIPAVTTRGLKEEEMMDIADYLHRTLKAREDTGALAKIREEVHAFSRKFPLPF